MIDRCLFSYIWRRKSSCLAKEPSHFFFQAFNEKLMATIPGKQFVWHQSKLCKLSIQSVHPNANDLFQIENKSSPYSFRQHLLQYKYTYLTEQRRAFASDSLYYNCIIHVILSSHTIIWNSGNVTIHQHAGDRQIRHNLNKKQGQFFLYYLVPWVNIRCKENASHCYAIWSKKLTWIKNYLKTLSSIGNDSFTILGNDGNRDGNCKLSHQTITTRKTKTTT